MHANVLRTIRANFFLILHFLLSIYRHLLEGCLGDDPCAFKNLLISSSKKDNTGSDSN